MIRVKPLREGMPHRMSLFRKLFGTEEASIQDRVDAISAEDLSKREADRSVEADWEFSSVFDPLPSDRPDIPESSDSHPSFWGTITGLGGFVDAIKSGELIYRKLDHLTAAMSPEMRLAAITRGVADLSPATAADLGSHLGVSSEPSALAQAIDSALFSSGGIEDLVRRLAPNAIEADGSVDFLAAVKDPAVQELVRALVPAFAEARKQQQG
jgi:hypothetical protein